MESVDKVIELQGRLSSEKLRDHCFCADDDPRPHKEIAKTGDGHFAGCSIGEVVREGDTAKRELSKALDKIKILEAEIDMLRKFKKNAERILQK